MERCEPPIEVQHIPANFVGWRRTTRGAWGVLALCEIGIARFETMRCREPALPRRQLRIGLVNMTGLAPPNCDNRRLSHLERRPFGPSILGTGGRHSQPQLRGRV